ncbi:MAG: biotin/lipoyl-containing protein [Faecalispora sporosphaeroides]|jgi:glutaconyl-CoA decarboxylase|uniref:Biotin/lipoyl-binding protein n=1 Tax=Faecalispora sporosphaeroides TaxID=1549 RepID=A0A928Q4N5_9FIRM|nr:biotin/lipoyl-containing protein [Faecalispora sporosphaeroides]MBE6832967.1 biotin/lipoyl-binding protein [Faecalispora sporosphaeroides]
MKNLIVTVNGVAYNVQVEETGAAAPVAPAAAPAPVAAPAPAAAPAPVAAPAPAPAPAPAAPKAEKPAAGANTVNAPMPGTILNVLVSAGDSVKKGQVLMILEAMKMENEIMAAQDGVIAGVHVSKGDAVNPGDALVSFQ